MQQQQNLVLLSELTKNLIGIELNSVQLQNFYNLLKLNINLEKNIQAERLEILGDAFLNFCITRYIFNKFSGDKYDEGFISKFKSVLVSKYSFDFLIRKLGFHKLIMNINPGKDISNLCADFLEVIFGWFLFMSSASFNSLEGIVLVLIGKFGKDIILLEENIDFKSYLQSNTQKFLQELPVYSTEKNEYDNQFSSSCKLSSLNTYGYGFNKKNSEQNAAKKMLLFLNLDIFLQGFYAEYDVK